jgi:hypothetical protein
MSSRALGLAAVLLTGTGCVIPFATPPVRAEVGAAAPIVRETAPRLQAAIGPHLASGTLRRDQPFDVGAGYLLGHDAGGTSHGIYVDAAKFIDRTRGARTALGGRASALRTPMGTSMGARLRIDHELYGPDHSDFSGGNLCGSTSGTRIGTLAAGMFAEVGPQRLPGGELAWLAAAGITIRLPASIGVYIGIPGCKR